jgi:hypothetical protein
VLAASLGALGCGSSTTTVTGQVYFGETLVKGGTVTLYCADGQGRLGGIREDGTYTIDQVPIGAVKVCVDTSALDPKRRKTYTYAPPPGKKATLPGGEEAAPGGYVAIPAKYATQGTTDLTFEATGGSQRYDIRMK